MAMCHHCVCELSQTLQYRTHLSWIFLLCPSVNSFNPLTGLQSVYKHPKYACFWILGETGETRTLKLHTERSQTPVILAVRPQC